MKPSGPGEELERLSATLDALLVGIIAVDGDGRVELQNSEASRILGVSRRITQGKPLADVLGAQHPAVELLVRVLDAPREVARTACAIRPRTSSNELTVDLAAAPIALDRGSDGAALTLHDRTIGRELEAMEDQAERTELYATLASGIAHEVRNPLGGIRGTAELLGTKLEGELRRYPGLIVEETDRIRRLLDDFAELTRGGDVRTRTANLHEILDKLVMLQKESKGWRAIDVRREYDPSIPAFALDPDRITQVFLNLMRNAVQAMDGEGRLVVRTRVETPYHLAASNRRAEDTGPLRWVRIEIEDNGPGIDAADLPHVFTPFFTRSAGGTGLGLAVSQHWVVKHGGRIVVEPAHAGGTRVRVLLPLRAPPRPGATRQPGEAA